MHYAPSYGLHQDLESGVGLKRSLLRVKGGTSSLTGTGPPARCWDALCCRVDLVSYNAGRDVKDFDRMKSTYQTLA